MLVPNNKQRTKLFQYANTARFAYNWALGKEQENYKNGGKFEIIPEEAEIVKQIFEWYANGDGFRKILIRLKEMNVTSTTGTNFSATTLKRMLKNEKYKGLLISHKTSHKFETKKTNKNNQEDYIVIPNGVPAIVSEELWNKCDKLRKSRQKNIKKQNKEKKILVIKNFIIDTKDNIY